MSRLQVRRWCREMATKVRAYAMATAELPYIIWGEHDLQTEPAEERGIPVFPGARLIAGGPRTEVDARTAKRFKVSVSDLADYSYTYEIQDVEKQAILDYYQEKLTALGWQVALYPKKYRWSQGETFGLPFETPDRNRRLEVNASTYVRRPATRFLPEMPEGMTIIGIHVWETWNGRTVA